jgi:prepilin-type N-terminal cleavage/methylation domain-containing protein
MAGHLAQTGFTLVELLIVVTIIVVLLALLTPAMDKAIYEAELAVCSAQQRTIAQGALNYALDQRRHYPHRPAVDNVESNWQAGTLYHKPGAWGPYDDRPTLRPYLHINRLLNDPLVRPVVLDEGPDAVPRSSDLTADVVSSTQLWFGYRYANESGMHRIGDRWTFGNGAWAFDVMVSDRDVVGGQGGVPKPQNDPAGWVVQGSLKTAGVKAAGVQSSHPDDQGTLANVAIQDGEHPWGGQNLNLTMSLWINLTPAYRGQRGTLDTNYTFQDLSVHRYRDVTGDDGRMIAVPTFVNKKGGPQQIPRG